MSVHWKMAGTTVAPVTAREFFTSVVPQVLAHRSAVCAQVGGRYAFVVTGDGGGAWTLDFDHTRVDEGIDAQQWRVYLEMSASSFGELLRGTFDVVAGASDGRLRIAGDVSALSNVLAVLEPPP